jgi:hypothetical protein
MRRVPALLAVLTSVALAACAQDELPMATPLPAESSSAPTPSASVTPGPPPIEGVEVLAEDPSHEHQDGPIEYDRVPPLGGPHNPRWLACGVYDEQVPDEVAVHSIEHGAVWITHDPQLPPDERAVLAELAASNPEYVLVSPRDGLDSRIVAVTWGAGLEASSAEDPRLAEFTATYAGGDQGGEPGAPCRTRGLTLEQARQLVGG